MTQLREAAALATPTPTPPPALPTETPTPSIIPSGPVTGFAQLDNELSGYLAPGIHVIQAAPGAGKSAFCLQVAASCGFPALYVTAEMGVLELFRRTVARETETFLGRLKSGELGLEAATKLARSRPRLASAMDRLRDRLEGA